MIKRASSSPLSRLLLAAAGAMLVAGAQADSLSAAAAEAALAEGALAWDVRAEAASGLPGALHIDAASLQAWLQQHDLAALQAAVSRAGLDLSRDIVVYGEAGDARAQALVESLQRFSRGRLHWLVGGEPEWTMSGRPLVATAGRMPVPQLLVSDKIEASPTMAGAALRAAPAEALLATR